VTGLRIAAEPLRLLSVVTTPDRWQNLQFYDSQPARFEDRGDPGREDLEAPVVDTPVRTAFPTHDASVAR
jgi:hypothetical protein